MVRDSIQLFSAGLVFLEFSVSFGSLDVVFLWLLCSRAPPPPWIWFSCSRTWFSDSCHFAGCRGSCGSLDVVILWLSWVLVVVDLWFSWFPGYRDFLVL